MTHKEDEHDAEAADTPPADAQDGETTPAEGDDSQGDESGEGGGILGPPR